MNKKIKKLTPNQIEELKKNFEVLKFENDFNIVYETQVPTAGFILLEGNVNFLKKNKIAGKLAPGAMIGIHQLIHNQPVTIGARVSANSDIIVLHKSEIMEAIKDKDSYLYTILKKLID